MRAARDLLDEGGLGAVTMDELAARTGVGKPTIYRSWPNAQAVAMAALMDAQTSVALDKPGRSVALDIRRHIQAVVDAFASRAGRSVATLMAAADAETELAKAFRHHVILKSRDQLRTLVLRGIDEGVLRRDADIETALDLLLGPVFFRLLVGHASLDEGFAASVTKQALDGLRAK
ncbi:MAG: TetR/AcrR family transcriptional regulator [Methylocystis sp.]|nr:TetR/AcrR family transcriptional regulator [Methylocystis sp.]